MKPAMLVAAAACLLAGCATSSQTKLPAVTCNVAGYCVVPVRVSNCRVYAPNVTVPGPILLLWQIDLASADYQFPYDSVKSPAIRIRGENPDDPQFVQPTRLDSYRYTLRDRYTLKKEYVYSINVVGGDGTVCPPFDAWIFNTQPTFF